LEPVELRSAGGATLTRLPDASVLASGASPETDTYTVRARVPQKGLTALRLELLPELPPVAAPLARLQVPGGTGPEALSQPGREPRVASREPILTDRRVAVSAAHPKPVTARFVRVENTGPERILSLAEVEVMSGGANIATRGKATQSSTDYDGLAPLAIDGNTN